MICKDFTKYLKNIKILGFQKNIKILGFQKNMKILRFSKYMKILGVSGSFQGNYKISNFEI